MGQRSRLTFAALLFAACRTVPNPPLKPAPPPPQPVAQPAPPKPQTMADKVVADFEAAIKAGRPAYEGLFDFAAVGEMEILLHRYDFLGRLKLSDDVKAQFAAEDGTPYPAERERKNVGGFYDILGQRTVGSGGCFARPVRTRYSRERVQLDPFPAGTHENYEALRQHAVTWVSKGGLIGMKCKGGRGGLALIWTERPNERGYDLITIYDD